MLLTGDDRCWLLLDAFWYWCELTAVDYRWLMLNDAGYCYKIQNDADYRLLLLNDAAKIPKQF